MNRISALPNRASRRQAWKYASKRRRPSTLRRAAFLIAAGVVAFVGTVAPTVLAADPVTVVISTTLSPKEITVSPGTLVTWVNQDSERHRIRSTSAPVEFDSGNIDQGETFSFEFNEPGTYQYRDERNTSNSDYFGTITVSNSGGGDPGTPPPPGSGGSTVDIVDRSFRPPALTVAPGTTVVWNNLDGAHTVTARDNSFDSGIFESGTYSRTFDAVGSYNYFCTLHPEMVGTITVTGDSGSTPPPTIPPPATPPTTVPPPPPPAPPGDVTIFDNGFTPSNKTISAGSTLVWSNTGALPHTITDRNGSFDSGFVMAGQTYRRTFSTPGSYSYFCTIHPGMTGTINVSGTATGQPDTGEISDPAPGDSDNDFDSSGVSLGKGSDDPETSDDNTLALSDARVAVDIIDLDYDPRDLTVEQGTTVTWTNSGELPHTVTGINGAFDSGLMAKNDVYERRFETLGTFDYLCTIHPNMVATVTVVEASGQTRTTAANTTPLVGDRGTTPPRSSGLSPEAGAIVGILFVMAAAITAGLGMFARKLLSSTPSST